MGGVWNSSSSFPTSSSAPEKIPQKVTLLVRKTLFLSYPHSKSESGLRATSVGRLLLCDLERFPEWVVREEVNESRLTYDGSCSDIMLVQVAPKFVIVHLRNIYSLFQYLERTGPMSERFLDIVLRLNEDVEGSQGSLSMCTDWECNRSLSSESVDPAC